MIVGKPMMEFPPYNDFTPYPPYMDDFERGGGGWDDGHDEGHYFTPRLPELDDVLIQHDIEEIEAQLNPDIPTPVNISVLNFTFPINTTFIFGAAEDQIILPLLLCLIAFCSFLGNGLIIMAILGFRRMRTGPNLMLLNIAISDLVFMVFCIPTAIVNHAIKRDDGPLTAMVCKFVHYVIFVTVYVGIYTLVVTCVFRLFSEVLSAKFMTLLSKGTAIISCVVIWGAFLVSHLNLLMQQDTVIFQEPFICVHTDSLIDQTKMRTLWVTFLTCAFLLPLLTIVALSAVILHSHSKNLGTDEAYDNNSNEMRTKRELTLVIMATMVVRVACWMPIQIFVMLDVFGMVELTETYRKAEMLGVCFAFSSACISAVVFNSISTDFRQAFHDISGCVLCQKPEKEKPCPPATVHVHRPTLKNDGSDMNETIMSILSDSSNHINYA